MVEGQVRDPKADFVEALAGFSQGLDGAYGDEGRGIRTSLEAMERGLEEWDAVIQDSEASMAADLAAAGPQLAARMHMALGGVYLDRRRADAALREFTAASQLDPNHADVYTFLGLTYGQLGNRDAATEAFRKAVALEPGDPVRAYLLARHLLTIGKAEEARTALGVFLDNWKRHMANPGTPPLDSPFIRLDLIGESPRAEAFFPPALYADGFALLQRGEFTPAIARFKEAIARDRLVAEPVDRREAMGLAAAAFRNGSIESAVQHLSVAVELSPNRAEPHRILGRVYLADQRDDEAIDEVKTAARLNPADERARVALAVALVEAGRYPEAERALRDTIKAFPASGRAHFALGRLHQRLGRRPEALREFAEAVTLTPLLGLNGIYQVMGAISSTQQDFGAALDAYSKRVDVLPNDAGAHQDLGKTYARLGRHTEALAEFAVALLLDPKDADAYAEMAHIHLRDGRNNDAADAARRAIAQDPSHIQARYALATSLMRLGRTDESQQELEAYQRLQDRATAAKSRQFQIDGLRREASESSAKGNHERAAELLRKVLEYEPAAAASYLDLGVALLKAGRTAEAIERFKSAEALNAHFGVHRYLAEAYAASGKPDESQREQARYTQLKQESLQRAGENR